MHISVRSRTKKQWHKEQEHPRGSIVEPQGLHQDGLNSLKRPQLSLHMCMIFSNCKGQEIEIKLELVRTLLRITRLAHKKSYMIIICPNLHEKLTKVKLGQVEVGLNISQNHSSSLFELCSETLVWPIESHFWSLLTPIHMKIWPKAKLGQVGLGLNIASNHFSSP